MEESEELPDAPDPGVQGTKFLGWLKRNRCGKTLTVAKKKLRHLHLKVEDTIDSWPKEKIRVAPQWGENFVWLIDTDWVDAWGEVHDVEMPHHSEYLKYKKKLQ
jgi:hypothetical protein